MVGVSVDALARRAWKTIDRKTSLKVLGGALAAAAMARDEPTLAARKGPKGIKRCQAQREQCLTFVETRICGRVALEAEARLVSAGTEECLAFYSPCCDSFSECKMDVGLRCLLRRPPRPQAAQ